MNCMAEDTQRWFSGTKTCLQQSVAKKIEGKCQQSDYYITFIGILPRIKFFQLISDCFLFLLLVSTSK